MNLASDDPFKALLQSKIKVFHLICAYLSSDSDKITFSLGKAILWIADSYFTWKQLFVVKIVLMIDLFNINTAFFSTRHVHKTSQKFFQKVNFGKLIFKTWPDIV